MGHLFIVGLFRWWDWAAFVSVIVWEAAIEIRKLLQRVALWKTAVVEHSKGQHWPSSWKRGWAGTWIEPSPLHLSLLCLSRLVLCLVFITEVSSGSTWESVRRPTRHYGKRPFKSEVSTGSFPLEVGELYRREKKDCRSQRSWWHQGKNSSLNQHTRLTWAHRD